MKIYEKEKYVTVTFSESPKYILYEWSKMSIKLADFQEMHLKALEIIKEKGVASLITDSTSVLDVPFKESVDWLGTELIPKLSAAGVKRLITVVPKTALSRIGTKSWQNKVMDIDMYDVGTKAEAIKLVI